MGLFDADGQTDKESWLDPESGLLFHNAKYNWNNNAVEENSGLLETPSLSLFEEFIAEEDKSIFEDITVEAPEPKGLMEIEPAEPAVVEETETAPEETDYETSRNAANVGLQGVNQFFHGVIDKEFDGGFMGFNPVNKLAHQSIGEHMRAYSDPDKITQDMVDRTRAMIVEKAGSQLGPEKTAYILERFNQYIQKVTNYQELKGYEK